MKKKRKKPADYPQFYFRISKEDKEEIEGLLNEILSIEASLRDDRELKPKRNDLITRSLKRGLKLLLSNYKNRN